VTGGAGFIGSHLVRRLLALGHSVRVVDNLSTGFVRNLDDVISELDFQNEDLRDPVVCNRATQGIDIVFHVAAQPSVPRSLAAPVSCHENNVSATLYLLEAARRNSVRRIVYSGSSSVYGDSPNLPKREQAEPLPRSPYAAAKLAGEQYTLAYARGGLVEGVALRYFNVFGPRQDPNGPYAAVIPLAFRSAVTGSPMILFGDGRQTRDFTHVDNVVEANVLAATHSADRVNGWAVNVGAGAQTSLLELVDSVRRVTGRSFPIEFQPARPGDVRDSLASLERAKTVLGYSPRVSLEEGLTRLWSWVEQQKEIAA
jgi:UDP-glucose 4-epimerase